MSLLCALCSPVHLKGDIRRNACIPYSMGANITPWVDTVVAALLLDSPRAFTIVFKQMVVGAVISLVVLLFFYKPYSSAIINAANHITHDRRAFGTFMAAIFIVPLVLFLV